MESILVWIIVGIAGAMLDSQHLQANSVRRVRGVRKRM